MSKMEERLLKAPTIQTDYLKIYGNALEFKDTALQLSNISLLSTKDVAPARFPGWSVILILIGVLLLQRNIILSLLAIAAGERPFCVFGSSTIFVIPIVITLTGAILNSATSINFAIAFVVLVLFIWLLFYL